MLQSKQEELDRGLLRLCMSVYACVYKMSVAILQTGARTVAWRLAAAMARVRESAPRTNR